MTGRLVDLTGIDLPGRSVSLSGYLATPTPTTHPGPWPGVVVMFEAFGLDVEVRAHADRLAAMGYLALVPDLYSDGGARRCVVATFRAMFTGEGRAVADMDAARLWLLGQPDCTGQVGVLGFCLGGSFALLGARRGFDAGAVNYAILPRDLDAAVDGACPLVASYGGRDASLRGAAGRLEAALRRAGVVHDVLEYPAAGHSFLNEGANGPRLLRPLLRASGAGPEPAAAAHAWARIEAFFATHLSSDSREEGR